MPQKLVCARLSTKTAFVVAEGGDDWAIESWTWMTRSDEVCYLSSDIHGRALRITDTRGRVLQEAELPVDFSGAVECTREGRVVVVDEADGNATSVVRVFSERLEREWEFQIPFIIYGMQVDPGLPERIAVIAGGRYGRNVVSMDVATGDLKQLTDIGGILQGSGYWKVIDQDRFYFTGTKDGKYSSRGLFVYDVKTNRVQTLVNPRSFAVDSFDVFAGTAVIKSHGQLYRMELASRRISPLAHDNRRCGYPVFSPSGQMLAFVRGQRELVVKDLATGQDSLVYQAR